MGGGLRPHNSEDERKRKMQQLQEQLQKYKEAILVQLQQVQEHLQKNKEEISLLEGEQSRKKDRKRRTEKEIKESKHEIEVLAVDPVVKAPTPPPPSIKKTKYIKNESTYVHYNSIPSTMLSESHMQNQYTTSNTASLNMGSHESNLMAINRENKENVSSLLNSNTPSLKKNESKLKKYESWLSLAQGFSNSSTRSTPSSLKSSTKDSFQQFEKLAIEKKHRERQLIERQEKWRQEKEQEEKG